MAEGELSRDIDALGNIKFDPSLNTPKRDVFASLKLRLVGEVKKWDKYSLCFYDLDNEVLDNTDLPFPNFLNNCYALPNFGGGRKLIPEYYETFGKFPISKSVCMLEAKEYNRGRTNEYKSGGNKAVYDASQNLALACEYFHRNEGRTFIEGSLGFPIHACFPTIITNAQIYRVKGQTSLKLKPVNFFLYLMACPDLDAVPVTTRNHMYLPILVSNFKGLPKVTRLLKRVSDSIHTDVKQLAQNGNLKREFDDFVATVYPKVR